MSLQSEIDIKSAEIQTDSYSMSIGELMNLYENKEIDIHPEFQRFYRWSLPQKSRLIESILLGIPLPPIFVYQRHNGVWDVIDGLQRLSTLFQFAGILRDENEELLPPLVLEKTSDLPSLEGKTWIGHGDEDDESYFFTLAQRLYIKRSKLDVKIILKGSDERSKYELFQRLNTGGTELSDQEVRNCILIMLNRPMYAWMRDLSKERAFIECLPLTERQLEEQYDMELLLRFIVFRRSSEEDLKNIGDLTEFLTNKMVELANENPDFNEDMSAFRYTFSLLNDTLKEDSFRKYDQSKDKFIGAFLVSAFEVIALGIGYHYQELVSSNFNGDMLIQRVKTLWDSEHFPASTGSRASTRVPRTIALGRELFSP